MFATPVGAAEEIRKKCGNIEPDDEDDVGDDRHDLVHDDEEEAGDGEKDDELREALAVEADEVNDLRGEENGEANRRAIVDGEDDIGDESQDHGGEEEVIVREHLVHVN